MAATTLLTSDQFLALPTQCHQSLLHELKAGQAITDPLLPDFSSPVSAFFELT
jgi:hypothetical protein